MRSSWFLLAFRLPIVALAASQCYFPNGQESSDSPCNPDADVSPCCGGGLGSVCLSNLLCQSPDGNIIRGSCTDQNWGEGCALYCLGASTGGTDLISCQNVTGTDTSYCCDHTNNCCDTGVARFSVLPANPATSATWNSASTIFSTVAISTTSSTTSTSTSSTETSSSGTNTSPTDGATSSTTPTLANQSPAASSNSSNNSTTVAAGVGAGVGAGVLLIAAGAFFLYRRWRKQKKAAKATTAAAAAGPTYDQMNAPKNEPTTGDYSQYPPIYGYGQPMQETQYPPQELEHPPQELHDGSRTPPHELDGRGRYV